MASFAFHDLENRLNGIDETSRLKNQQNEIKPQRAVLGVINQNIKAAGSTAIQPRKAKAIANQKLGIKVYQDENEVEKSYQPKENLKQQTQKNVSSSFFNKKNDINIKKTSTFTIHQDDSSDEIQNKCEKKIVESRINKKYTNKENEVLDELLPKEFCKTKIWKDDVDEPMSCDKSILSPMSVDMSQTETCPSKKRNSEDELCVVINMEPFRDDIFQYLLQCERRIRPKENYMRKQPDINSEMRSVLVDWLVEVAEEYKMQNETLHLAINYVDRFLSQMSVVRSKLQLLGTTALFIASKYEEIYPPEVSEFVYITDDTYTKKHVLKMEQLILKVLDFDLNIPTSHTFICHIVVSAHLGPSVLYMAQYFSELVLVSGDPFLQYLPSQIASASIALSRYCLDYEEIWPDLLYDITGYKLEEITPCVKHLHEIHSKVENGSQKAAYSKYKLNQWNNVSLLEPRTFTS